MTSALEHRRTESGTGFWSAFLLGNRGSAKDGASGSIVGIPVFDPKHTCTLSAHKGGWFPREHIREPLHMGFHDVHPGNVFPREIAVLGRFIANR